MPLMSHSFALGVEFPHSWVSFQKCLLPAQLAQRGKQIRMAYAAVTRRPAQNGCLGTGNKTAK